MTYTDVHTDRQKLGTILENKVVQKLKFSESGNNKKISYNLVFLDEKNQKDSNDFLHRKLTLKVRFRHLLTTHVNICESQIKMLWIQITLVCSD